MSDPWDDPEAKAWKRHVEQEVAPAMQSSKVCISIAPPRGRADVKFCVELGFAIMFDKPIVIVAETNDDVPPKLRAIADQVLIGTVGEPGFNKRLIAMMEEMGMM